MKIVTDMNTRERKRYSDKLKNMASAFHKMSVDLIDGNDQGVLIGLITVLPTGGYLNELIDIFHNAAQIDIPNTPEGIDERHG